MSIYSHKKRQEEIQQANEQALDQVQERQQSTGDVLKRVKKAAHFSRDSFPRVQKQRNYTNDTENSGDFGVSGMESRLQSNEYTNESLDKVDQKRITRSAFTPYLLLVALSFHGMFEGMGVGVQRNLYGTITLSFAVLLHKWSEALTLGIAFSKGSVERKHAYSMMIIFGSASPLGIALGWAFSGSSDLLAGIFMAISAGTFIYISAAEIIVEEFSVSAHKWVKFLCYSFGLVLIIALWFTEVDD